MLEDFRLKVFMTVASERSFTKAAAALGISQPAVSQNISELERETGMKLFDRLRGEVAITPQGQLFHEYAARILSSYEDMNTIFCNHRINNRTAPVKIFISPVLAPIVYAPLMEKIHVLYPSLAVEMAMIEDDSDVRILAETVKKDADLNVRVSVLSDDIYLQVFFKQLVEVCI